MNSDMESESTPLRQKMKEKVTKQKAEKFIKKIFPILNWLPTYQLSYLSGDFIAGLTVALLIIPQALAYGLVAGLTPSYGLYSAFAGGFVYFIFGTVKDINIGPTAIMALMTYEYSLKGGADYAVFLCFISGVIQVISAVLNLGFLINFISHPVISGFTSAAALTIASSQVKSLFGMSMKTKGFVDTWRKVLTNLPQTRWQDLVLGCVCIVVLLFMKEMRSMKWGRTESNTTEGRFLKNVIFYASVGRNALVVVITSLIAFSLDDNQPFRLTGAVMGGIPPITPPSLSTTFENTTRSFTETVTDIGFGIFTIPFISTLDHIAVAGAFSKGKSLDATQEILALGMVNIVGSFFGSLPTTASLSRTAINMTSGVHSPAGGIVTGLIVLLSLAFLTPYFRYIPKACLAAVIISAVLHMFEYEVVKPMWRSKRIDLIPLFVTFILCLLLSLEWGIIIGIIVNLAMLLYSIATPTIHTKIEKLPLTGSDFVLVTPTTGMSYPNSVNLRSAIEKAGTKQGSSIFPVIVDGKFITEADYTCALALKGVISNFETRKQLLVFMNISQRVQRIILLNEKITFCDSLEEADEYFQGSETKL